MRNNFDEIKSYFDISFGGSIGRIVLAVTNDFNTKLKLDELNYFYQQHIVDFGGNNRDVNKAVQRTKASVNWVLNSYETIVDWLHNRTPDDVETTTAVTAKTSITGSGSSKLNYDLNILLMTFIMCLSTILFVDRCVNSQ